MAETKKVEIANLLMKNFMNQSAVVKMGYLKGTVSKVARELRKGWRPPRPEDTPESEAGVSIGLEETPGKKGAKPAQTTLRPGQVHNLVTFVTKAPSPVTVNVKGSAIDLEDDSIYRSWILFQDMVRRGIVNPDSFSSTIEDGIGLLWSVLVVTPSLQGLNVVPKEAEHGGSAGHGEKETGARGPAQPAAAATG